MDTIDKVYIKKPQHSRKLPNIDHVIWYITFVALVRLYFTAERVTGCIAHFSLALAVPRPREVGSSYSSSFAAPKITQADQSAPPELSRCLPTRTSSFFLLQQKLLENVFALALFALTHRRLLTACCVFIHWADTRALIRSAFCCFAFQCAPPQLLLTSKPTLSLVSKQPKR